MPCVSCLGPLPPNRKLFCSDVCSEFAKNVRYHRRVIADGRISQPDVEDAVALRQAYAFWGQAPKTSLPRAAREAVFAAKGRRCVACGAPATDIDHIHSAAFGDDSLSNLQPLCHRCHLEKTSSSPMPWDTTSSDARTAFERRRHEYLQRVQANAPLRACDDDLAWPTAWRAIVAERVRDRIDAELVKALREVSETGIGSESIERPFEDAVARLGGGQTMRRKFMARIEELAKEVAEDWTTP